MAKKEPRVLTDARTSPTFDVSAWQARILLAVLTAAGLWLRLFHLGQKTFWGDESLQLNGVKLPIAEIRQHLFAIDFMPPLSYAVQRLCWLPFQTTYAARFPGAVVGVLMIPLMYWAVRRVTNRLGGVLAAFFATFSFFLVYYSQECRAYIFFGTACALLLAQWLGLLLTPPSVRVPKWRWWALALSGVLCGAFHFATLLLLPALGVVSTGFLMLDARSREPSTKRGAYAWRWIAYFVALGAAALASYAIMRYSVDPAKSPMDRVSGDLPSLQFLRIFSGYVWGSGWRWLPVLGLVGCAFIGGRGSSRRVAVAVALLILLPTTVCYFVLPGFLSVSRYFFWSQWCFAVLLTLGVLNVAQRLPRRGARLGWVGLVLGVFALIHVPLFEWYYASPTKIGADLRTFKRQVEDLGESRLFAMGNGYQIHHLQHYWPTNAVYTPAPTWNTRDEYQRMNVADWLLAVMDAYPNTLLYFDPTNDSSGRVRARAELIYRKYSACADPVELQRIVRAGFNMIGGAGDVDTVGTDFRYTDDSDWQDVARTANRALLLFPSDMPLTTTVDGSMRYSLWRVLHRPSAVRVFNPDATNRLVTATWPVACLSAPATLVVVGEDGSARQYGVPEGVATHFDSNARKWSKLKISVQEVVRVGTRAILQCDCVLVSYPMELRPGLNRFTLVPQGAPLLMGPTGPELNLKGAFQATAPYAPSNQ